MITRNALSANIDNIIQKVNRFRWCAQGLRGTYVIKMPGEG